LDEQAGHVSEDDVANPPGSHDTIDCAVFLKQQQHEEGHPPRAQILPDLSTVLERVMVRVLGDFPKVNTGHNFRQVSLARN
jgi:hypothetical protein